MQIYIIGGGVIGSAVAREIRLRNLSEVVVLEKEENIVTHASGRNSGVIHSGINQFPGSIKAEFCLKGSRELRKYCSEKNIPFKECGTIVTARNKQEEFVLYTLLGMGRQVGVPNIEIINKSKLAEKEPAVNASLALFSPTGAVVNSQKLVETLADEAKSLGAKYKFGEKVISIEKNNIATQNTKFHADYVINCAGLYADKIAHMMNAGERYFIVPFRGEYMEVNNLPIRTMVYAAPDLNFPFLGVHFTRSIDGKLLAGPSASLAFGREAYDKQVVVRETADMLLSQNFLRLILSKKFLKLAVHNTKLSLSKKAFMREISSLLKAPILDKNIIPHKAGIRAQIVSTDGKMLDDILVEHKDNSTHVLNAVSPGMTCSLAFAEHIVGEIAERIK
ncbi:MAG: L-2-hydroxyglutarate oxidase [Nanoarchaeota archaeon]